MKKKQKQNKKKYDSYRHKKPTWQKLGFTTKDDYDRWLSELDETF